MNIEIILNSRIGDYLMIENRDGDLIPLILIYKTYQDYFPNALKEIFCSVLFGDKIQHMTFQKGDLFNIYKIYKITDKKSIIKLKLKGLVIS
jgi:hypothetical protein